MISVLASLLLGAFQQQVTTRAAVKLESSETASRLFAEAEPDVVLRGRTATLVVRGRDLASLKTLTVSPAAGITVHSITPLPKRSDGTAAVQVELEIAGDAEPGERSLLLTDPPRVMTSSGVRPGSDSLTARVNELASKVIREQATPSEAGWLYVNSHELLVTAVTLGTGKSSEVLITVTDAAGDLETPVARATGDVVFLNSSDLLTSEARCGRDMIDSVLDDARVKDSRPGSVTLAARLARDELPAHSMCTLRVRVRDKAHNTSPWFSTRGMK
jgi:hypothetical protein